MTTKHPILMFGHWAHVVGLAREALAEDAREGSHFDAEGFSNFMPEEQPDDIRGAWLLYDRIVYGGETPEAVLE